MQLVSTVHRQKLGREWTSQHTSRCKSGAHAVEGAPV